MLRGRQRSLEVVHKIEPKLNCRLHNRFDIEVIDAKTGLVRQRAQAENTICSNLWTRLFNSTESLRLWNKYIHYGTGSGTPSASDTSLFTFLGYGTPVNADDVFSWGDDGSSCSLRRKIQIDESTAVGAVLSEVGIAYGTASTTLCTHAMLKDMNGNDVTITKTDTDIINIYATVYVHWSASGYDGGKISIIKVKNFFYYFFGTTITSDTNQRLCSLPNRVVLKSGAGYGYGYTNETFESGGINNGVNELIATLDSSTKKITLTSDRYAVAKANFGGARSAYLSAYSVEYSGYEGYNSRTAASVFLELGGTWFQSSSITGEAIGTGDGTTTDFATDFSEVSNVTVYENGVVKTSGVTVDTGLPGNLTNFGQELNRIDEFGNKIWGILPVATYDKIPFVGGTYYYENPWYETVGIESMTVYDGATATTVDIFMSNDLTTWTQVYTKSDANALTIPSAYQNYRYIKIHIVNPESGTGYASGISGLIANVSANNIHFDTAPADGAVITADYTTKSIAKDANHVFDLSIELTIGEYTE